MIERKIFFSIITVFFLFGAVIGGVATRLYFVPETTTELVYDVCVDPRRFR